MKSLPSLNLAEWIDKNEVRLFFSNGKVVEVKLPVRSAKRVRVVERGHALDPGDGLDIGVWTLLGIPGKVLRKASC